MASRVVRNRQKHAPINNSDAKAMLLAIAADIAVKMPPRPQGLTKKQYESLIIDDGLHIGPDRQKIGSQYHNGGYKTYADYGRQEWPDSAPEQWEQRAGKNILQLLGVPGRTKRAHFPALLRATEAGRYQMEDGGDWRNKPFAFDIPLHTLSVLVDVPVSDEEALRQGWTLDTGWADAKPRLIAQHIRRLVEAKVAEQKKAYRERTGRIANTAREKQYRTEARAFYAERDQTTTAEQHIATFIAKIRPEQEVAMAKFYRTKRWWQASAGTVIEAKPKRRGNPRKDTPAVETVTPAQAAAPVAAEPTPVPAAVLEALAPAAPAIEPEPAAETVTGPKSVGTDPLAAAAPARPAAVPARVATPVLAQPTVPAVLAGGLPSAVRAGEDDRQRDARCRQIVANPDRIEMAEQIYAAVTYKAGFTITGPDRARLLADIAATLTVCNDEDWADVVGQVWDTRFRIATKAYPHDLAAMNTTVVQRLRADLARRTAGEPAAEPAAPAAAPAAQAAIEAYIASGIAAGEQVVTTIARHIMMQGIAASPEPVAMALTPQHRQQVERLLDAEGHYATIGGPGRVEHLIKQFTHAFQRHGRADREGTRWGIAHCWDHAILASTGDTQDMRREAAAFLAAA